MREVRVERPYTNLSMDPVRGTVALFVQEVLYKVLRDEAADPALFEFIQEALESMDTAEDLSHFPSSSCGTEPPPGHRSRATCG